MTSSLTPVGIEPVVQAADIVKTYSGGAATVTALKHVSIDIQPGVVTAIVGPSGAGKSTLLRCLAGLDRVTSGTVRIGGDEITKLDDRSLAAVRRGQVGFVFQDHNLVSTLTVGQNIELPLELDGKASDLRRLGGVLAALGLERDVLKLLPAQLSIGQQQRVALARALATSPQVVVADEPAGSLDVRRGQQFLTFLRRCCDELGQTVIVASHDPAVASYADRVIVLCDGRVTDDLTGASVDDVFAAVRRAVMSAAAAAPDEEAAAMLLSEVEAVGASTPVVTKTAKTKAPKPPKAPKPAKTKAARPPKPAKQPKAKPAKAEKAAVASELAPAPVAAPAAVVGSPEYEAAFQPVEQQSAHDWSAPVAAAGSGGDVLAPTGGEAILAPEPAVSDAVPTVDEWEARLAEFDRLTGEVEGNAPASAGLAAPVPEPVAPAPEPAPLAPEPATLPPESASVPAPPESAAAAAEDDDWAARVRALLDLSDVSDLTPPPAAPVAPTPVMPVMPEVPVAEEPPVYRPPVAQPQPELEPEPEPAQAADDWVAQLWASTSAEAGLGLDGMPVQSPPPARKRPGTASRPATTRPAATPPTPPVAPPPAAPAAPTTSPADDLPADEWVSQWWAAHNTSSDQ